MQTFFKYLGIFCLVAIAMSLTMCSFGIYQGVQTANRYLAGADNYTCRQFIYDMQQPETDKFAPMAIAAIAYGVVPQDAAVAEERQDEVSTNGIEPALKKVYALCKNNESERVLNLYAATIVPQVSTTAPVSATTAQ